jgi:hypothetical protein
MPFAVFQWLRCGSWSSYFGIIPYFKPQRI